MSVEKAKADKLFQESEIKLERFKLGLPEETALQITLSDIGDLKTKLESSLTSAYQAIEEIHKRLPEMEREYLARLEISEASKRLVESMNKFSDLERIEGNLKEALVDVGDAFQKLNTSLSDLNKLMRDNITAQDHMRTREKTTLDLLNEYLRKYV